MVTIKTNQTPLLLEMDRSKDEIEEPLLDINELIDV